MQCKTAIESAGGQAEVIGFDVSNEEAFVAGIKTIIEADGEAFVPCKQRWNYKRRFSNAYEDRCIYGCDQCKSYIDIHRM